MSLVVKTVMELLGCSDLPRVKFEVKFNLFMFYRAKIMVDANGTEE